MKAQNTGLKRILKAFVYSYQGFIAAFKSEAAFRQDILFVLVFCAIAICLNIPMFQKFCLFFGLLLILLMELVNTAIETIIDRISQDYHPLSGKAKDIGSLLVLLAFVNAILLWAAIIYEFYF